ncbi:MAG: hypothetical protein ABEI75_00550 [Halobaculum sp.]
MSSDTPDRQSITEQYPEIADTPEVVDLTEMGTVRLGLYDERFADADNVEMPDDPAPWSDSE